MKRFVTTLLCVVLLVVFAMPGYAALQKGSKGEDVVALQERLIEMGYLTGAADGAFGNMTKAALEAFQKMNGLDITGTATIKDINALFSDDAIYANGAALNSDAGSVPTVENVKPTVEGPIILDSSVSIFESDSVLEIKEAGFSMSSGYLYYAVILHNNSDKLAVQFPTFRMTARDASGALLGTEDQVGNIIYPNQDFVWAGLAYSIDERPAKVEFEVVEPDDYNVMSASALSIPTYKPLEVTGVNKKGSRILGEVYNPNDYTIEQTVVTVVFRDDNGALIGGDLTFVDSLKAGAKIPFDMDLYIDFANDNYTVYANSWDMVF